MLQVWQWLFSAGAPALDAEIKQNTPQLALHNQRLSSRAYDKALAALGQKNSCRF